HCLRRSGDDEDLESVESFDEFVEAAVRHGDLDVLVLSSLPPEEELDRPPRRDVPRNLDTVEQPGDFLRTPGIPLRDVRLDRVHARNCGSTCSANSRICSCRFAPHSSSMTCVHPASRYSSIAAMQSDGVPA